MGEQDPSNDVIVGHVVLEPADLQAGMNLRLRRWALKGALSWLCLTALFIGIHTLVTPPGSPTPSAAYWLLKVGVPAACGFALLSAVLYVLGRSARQGFAGKSREQLTTTYELGPDGFAVSTPESTSRSAWTAFVHHGEVPAAFRLYHTRAAYQILPKRAFRQEDVPRVRSLLDAHLSPVPTRTRILRNALILWIIMVAMFMGVYFLVGAPSHP